MKIRKALITAAGFGTRFLPISKTVQKEMLPILSRPVIDYLVLDCIKAGIEEIIIVVKESSEHDLIHHYYHESEALNRYLQKMNKTELSKNLRGDDAVKYRFVTQSAAEEYGTAVPVKLAREFLQDEDAFVVLMGDDFLFNADGSSEVKKMIEFFEQHSAQGLATCIQKPEEELFRYGAAKIHDVNGVSYLDALVEKPKAGEAPSNLVNISKYIFTPAIFDIIEHQKLNPDSGELYITDSLSAVAKNSDVLVYQPAGTYLDAGNVFDWLKANIVVGLADPEIAGQLRKFLHELSD